jgi:cyanophycinase
VKRKYIYFVLLSMSLWATAQPPVTIKEGTTRHGPEKGSLIIIGGGGLAPDIWSKFIELAGGKEKAKIVVVTTASDNPSDTRLVETVKRETGATQVTALHTTDVNVANSKEFAAILDGATGVFFGGGRQFRIADAYLNTLTHQAFWDVLERGGVIAGSSAGASIQGCNSYDYI